MVSVKSNVDNNAWINIFCDGQEIGAGCLEAGNGFGIGANTSCGTLTLQGQVKALGEDCHSSDTIAEVGTTVDDAPENTSFSLDWNGDAFVLERTG